MFQVEIKTNDVISCVSVDASSKKEAIAKVKGENPKSKYVRCWVGNPSVVKSPVGPPMEQILEKLNKKKKNEEDSISI